MRQIVTSDQFVAGVISALALEGRRHFVLTDTELDGCFQSAFEELLVRQEQYDIVPNFTFYVDSLHGDSVCLREALLAAKEKELIALNNPTFRTFDIKVDEYRAKSYLQRNPLPIDFFELVIKKHFLPMPIDKTEKLHR